MVNNELLLYFQTRQFHQRFMGGFCATRFMLTLITDLKSIVQSTA
jgi:hypothetical protein